MLWATAALGGVLGAHLTASIGACGWGRGGGGGGWRGPPAAHTRARAAQHAWAAGGRCWVGGVVVLLLFFKFFKFERGERKPRPTCHRPAAAQACCVGACACVAWRVVVG
jgi:hypothetical protein